MGGVKINFPQKGFTNYELIYLIPLNLRLQILLYLRFYISYIQAQTIDGNGIIIE